MSVHIEKFIVVNNYGDMNFGVKAEGNVSDEGDAEGSDGTSGQGERRNKRKLELPNVLEQDYM